MTPFDGNTLWVCVVIVNSALCLILLKQRQTISEYKRIITYNLAAIQQAKRFLKDSENARRQQSENEIWQVKGADAFDPASSKDRVSSST